MLTIKWKYTINRLLRTRQRDFIEFSWVFVFNIPDARGGLREFSNGFLFFLMTGGFAARRAAL